MEQFCVEKDPLTCKTEPTKSAPDVLLPINPNAARFPFCIVWTPLPIVSWLAPFVGHIGICQEDGVILDFAGSFFVNVDNFAFGATARYARLSMDQCCFPPHLSGHTCKTGFSHAQVGTAISWNDGLRSSMQKFQHKSYNMFTCNCHSFVASCLNRFAYQGYISWNIITVIAFVLFKGRWVDKMAVVRSFAPFIVVMCIGLFMAGWPFFIGWASFSFLLIGWFILGAYCFKGLIEC
eukprot:c26199_g1_i1 orf=385-1092(-)